MAFDRLDSVGLAYLWGKLKAFFATKSLVGDTTMGTTATTVTGAIKEHSDLIGSTTMGTTASTLTGAIAEHESDISNLNSKLSNNIFNNNINISSYTSSRYTFPSDGYLVCNAGSSSNSKAVAYVYDGNNRQLFVTGGYSNNTYPNFAVFVRKGMKCIVSEASNNGTVTFCPLSS